jgi:hypothetical protein
VSPVANSKLAEWLRSKGVMATWVLLTCRQIHGGTALLLFSMGDFDINSPQAFHKSISSLAEQHVKAIESIIIDTREFWDVFLHKTRLSYNDCMLFAPAA